MGVIHDRVGECKSSRIGIKFCFPITLAIGLLAVFSEGAAAQQANPAKITGVTPGGVGYVQTSDGPNGIDALVGRWDTPYPGGTNGPRAPGLEPYGASTVTIDVDVNDGGTISFDYYFETYDAGIYDWLDITLITPTGNIQIASKLGNPASSYGYYWVGPRTTIVQKLTPWRNKHVQLVISVQQDGWGDQSAAQVSSLAVRTCSVPPLTPLTDPAAIAFEDGNTVDTADLVPALQTALSDFITLVANAGGGVHVTSAYRPPSYQSHLREVWDKHRLLLNFHCPTGTCVECEDLRIQVNQEFTKHQLLPTQRPATPSGPHTQGLAFDANVNGLNFAQSDALAAQAGLTRPLPATDPVHYQLSHP